MSKLNALESTQLRYVYYLLSIDLVEFLKNTADISDVNADEISRKICYNANDIFGIVLEPNEIKSLFITPLIKYLDINTLNICSAEYGRYGLTHSHFEFTSSLSLFLNSSTTK